jgi:hypothetical protein
MKIQVAALTEVPEPLRGEYEQKDGAFFLKLEGEIPELVSVKKDLTEFRDNNIKYLKEKDAAVQKLKEYDGIDPVEYAAMKQKLVDLEKKGGVKDPSDIETKIRLAVDAAVTPLKEQVQLEQKTRVEAELRLKQRDLETRIRDVGTKLKVLDSAMPDLLSRGLRVFRASDGLAYDGEKQMYSKEKVTEPLSLEEWGRMQLAEAPHLFVASTGGGARPGPGGTGKRTISAADPVELGRNADAIAKGEILVTPVQ